MDGSYVFFFFSATELKILIKLFHPVPALTTTAPKRWTPVQNKVRRMFVEDILPVCWFTSPSEFTLWPRSIDDIISVYIWGAWVRASSITSLSQGSKATATPGSGFGDTTRKVIKSMKSPEIAPHFYDHAIFNRHCHNSSSKINEHEKIPLALLHTIYKNCKPQYKSLIIKY